MIELYNKRTRTDLNAITEFVKKYHTDQALVASDSYNEAVIDVEHSTSTYIYAKSKVKSSEYYFVLSVFLDSIKEIYFDEDDENIFKRLELEQFLSTYIPDFYKINVDIDYSFDVAYNKFKSCMFEICNDQRGYFSEIFVLFIYIVNDGKYLKSKPTSLLYKFLHYENIKEFMKLKFTVVQLKLQLSDNKDFTEYCNSILRNLYYHFEMNSYSITPFIEYHYQKRFLKDTFTLDTDFESSNYAVQVPNYICRQLKVNLMIHEFLLVFKEVCFNGNNEDFSVWEYEQTIATTHKNGFRPISFFLNTSNSIDNEWILRDINNTESVFSVSEFHTLIASPGFYEIKVKFNPDLTNSKLFKIIFVKEDNCRTDELIRKPEVSLLSIMPKHIIKRILAKLSNSQLLDMITLNKTIASIIVEIIYYRPFASGASNLRRLEMSLVKSAMNLTLFPYYVYVKRLNYSYFSNIVDEDTLTFFSFCSYVERLTLVNCFNITGDMAAYFIDNLNNNSLTSLDMTGVSELGDLLIVSLVNKCSLSLQGLYMPNLECSKKFIMELIKNCINIKRLRLSRCRNLDNEVVFGISNFLHNLVELDLSGCEDITSDSIFKVLSKIPNLRDLNLSGCKKVDHKFLNLSNNMGLKLRKLKNLDIGNLNSFHSLSDNDIKILIKLAPNLKHLTINKHSDLTDNAVAYISTLSKTLTTLNIGHLTNITDKSLLYLSECSRLKYLDLSSCDNITSSGFIMLSRFKRLKRLGLVKCNKLDDYALFVLISQTQASFERVHLSYCSQLTGFAILELLKRHPNIQHLSLSGIPSIRSIFPSVEKFSRPPPANFTREQRISFAIFSGAKDVAGFKDILENDFVDRNINKIIAGNKAEKCLFESYIHHCKYENLNFKGLVKFCLKEIMNTNFAYDFLLNRYDSVTISSNEAIMVAEARSLIDNEDIGIGVYNSKAVFDFFNSNENKEVEEMSVNENVVRVKDCNFNQLTHIVNNLDNYFGYDNEQSLVRRLNLDEKMPMANVIDTIQNTKDLILNLKKSLEVWENNTFSYLTIPLQRSSTIQFKRIESHMNQLKVLYTYLYLLKHQANFHDIKVWVNQIKPILSHIIVKFEQLSYIALFKELVSLIQSLNSFKFISNWNVIITLTSNLREKILWFRKYDYTATNNEEKYREVQTANDKLLSDLMLLGSEFTENDIINMFPAFNI